MTSIPQPMHSAANQIDAWHEQHQSPPRPHMGLSAAGNEDDRGLWLSFRWAFQEQFTGRILRLFRRGHLEEAVVVSDLQAIGCEVEYTGDAQLHIDFGSHVSGSCDGIIASGLPEAPNTVHLLEIKTISKARFEQLDKHGVEKSTPEYYAQTQAYMFGLTQLGLLGVDVERCFFIAVCKDDDRVYTERIKLNKDIARDAVARLQRIALSERIPEPVHVDPTFYKAKFSPYYAVYFPKSATPDHMAKLVSQRAGDGIESKVGVNCRTCAHSTPTESSEWLCAIYDNQAIPLSHQRLGCRAHVMHPDIMDLIGWRFVEGDAHNATYQSPKGEVVKNGVDGVYSEDMLGGAQCD